MNRTNLVRKLSNVLTALCFHLSSSSSSLGTGCHCICRCRQIQFEDINEEYSATSNQDSSELKTASTDKYRFSSNAVTSKSDHPNFPVLIIDQNKNEDKIDLESLEVTNEDDEEDQKMISARTIHSEISEIPLESDGDGDGDGGVSARFGGGLLSLSDQDQEELDKVFENQSEKPERVSSSTSSTNQENFYSEDFSESIVTKHSTKTISRQDQDRRKEKMEEKREEIQVEEKEEDEKFSYKEEDDEETSSEPSTSNAKSNGGASAPPKIPLRRKFMISQSAEGEEEEQQEDLSVENKKENFKQQQSVYSAVETLCSHLYEMMFDQIMNEDVLAVRNDNDNMINTRPAFVPRLIGLNNDDDDTTNQGNGDAGDRVKGKSSSKFQESVSALFQDDFPLEIDESFTNDAKFVSLASLIPWNDGSIMPLVDRATEYLFHARQNREKPRDHEPKDHGSGQGDREQEGEETGPMNSTADAFEFCRQNMPAEFMEVNKDDQVARIYQQWMTQRLRDQRDHSETPKLFVSRTAIFVAVLEIMRDIYELDDCSDHPSPWMTFSFDSMKRKKFVLWQGIDPPESLDLVRRIVKKQLESINIIGTSVDRTHSSLPSSMKRSRQHRWFIRQTDDVVDKLLIDETFQDDINWLNYDQAIEKTVFAISDEILDNEITELSNSFLRV